MANHPTLKTQKMGHKAHFKNRLKEKGTNERINEMEGRHNLLNVISRTNGRIYKREIREVKT